MKTCSRLRYFIYISIIFMGCSTGKNALRKGDYDASLLKAVHRLQSAPQNSEAMEVLRSAYSLSLTTHQRKIEEAEGSANPLRWETILGEYEQLQSLSEELARCPSCLTLVPAPQRFTREVESSRQRAAEARYTLGLGFLNEGSKAGARKAYSYFERAQFYAPADKQITQKLNEAYQAALLRVLVLPALVNSRSYELSNQYFQDQIAQWAAAYQQNKFVRFYMESEVNQSRVIPDQVVAMQFDDFVVGQTYLKEKVEKLTKDSVKVGETRADGPIYGKVTATLHVFDKKVSSSGLLDLRISDAHSGKVLRHKKLTGTYVWQDQWANYKGDERALSREQLALSKRKETMPPPPAALFVELTKPLYSQLISELHRMYDAY